MIGLNGHSLRAKIIFSLIVIVTLSLGIFQSYSYALLHTQLMSELNTLADQKIDRLSRDLDLPMWELDEAWIKKVIESELVDERVHAVFVTGAGDISVDYNRDKTSDKHLHQNSIFRSHAILHNGKKIGEIKLYLSTDLMHKRLYDETLKAVTLTLLEIIAVTLFLWIMIQRLIVSPVKALVESTQHIADGEYDHPMLELANDEIGRLGASVESMKSKIQLRESEILKSKEELDRFFSVTLDLLCIADTQGNFIRLNKSWSKVLGYPLQEIYAHKFFDYIHPDDIGPTLDIVERLKAQETIIFFTNRYRTKSGSYIWLEWRSVPVGDLVYAAAHDITESVKQQKALEEANTGLEIKVAERTEMLQEANQKLKELDKLKSMFIASMSHELRTPLNSIIGFTSVLLQGLSGPLNDTQNDQLRRVKSAGQHLLSLIGDVIDISKIEAGRVIPFAEAFLLNDLLLEAYNEVEILAKPKGLELKIEEVPMIEMFTDKKRLYQCLLNYLSNAIKFSESGQIILSAKKEDGTVRIWVQDNGIGIAEKDRPRIFEAFERLETHLRVLPGGTGLGLYLTRKITEELLEGSVWYESKEGEGSTFGLVIPQKITPKEEEA